MLSTVRIIWFLDTQGQGSVPAVTDVITTTSVTSFYNSFNLEQKRFVILSDKGYSLVTTASNQTHFIQQSFKPKCVVTYGAATNVAAANRRNALYMLIITDAAAAQPTFQVNCGMRFHDA